MGSHDLLVKRFETAVQVAELKSGEPVSNTERASLEGRSVDPASSSMVSLSNLGTPWSPGSPVVIQGLKGAPQHSGKEGRLIEQLPDEHRWVVQLVGEEKPFKIKEENLKISPRRRQAVLQEGRADASIKEERALQRADQEAKETEWNTKQSEISQVRAHV